jgi:hypothetical protein
MPFREKLAWISLTSTLLIWGSYFVEIGLDAAAGRLETGALLGLFVGRVILSVVVEVVLATAAALLTPKEANARADEREQLIALKATNAAYGVLSFGAVIAAVTGALVAVRGAGLLPQTEADVAFVSANGVLFALLLAEVVRSTFQIVGYRRGR